MEELRNSPRYMKTFAEYIKSGDDEEIRALLTENVSGTIPVPELVYDAVKTAWTRDGIMNLVRKSYLKGNLKVGFEISSDGAQIHSEGADRIDEEQLVLGVVNLIPSNIKKYIAISDEVYDLAPEEFLTYVYSELTYQIAKKCGEELVNRIVSLSTQSNVPVVDYIDSSITVSTVAMALSKLCSEAQNPVIVMNKASWGQFKKAQYENKFRVDPFEGLPVVFNNALKPFNSATTGETFAIVGDFGNGALANYPNGEDILVKTDDITLAQSDLIKIIGRQYVAVDVVAPNHFTVINKGDEVTPIVPTGNIEITENGENINVAPYATATVNVSGGGGTKEITYISGTYTPTLDDENYMVIITNPILNKTGWYLLTMGNTTQAVYLDSNAHYYYDSQNNIVGASNQYGTMFLTSDDTPIFIELKEIVDVYAIAITLDNIALEKDFVVYSLPIAQSNPEAFYQSVNHAVTIERPYTGAGGAYIYFDDFDDTSMDYRDATNCTFDTATKFITVTGNNASIEFYNIK